MSFVRGLRRNWLSLTGGIGIGLLVATFGPAQAQRAMAPSDPEVLVALAQLLEVENKRVDLLLRQGDVDGAIRALEALRGRSWPSRARGGDAALQLRHDVYGRLVRLRLDHPKVDPQPPEAVLKLVSEGLGKDYEQLETNLFTARLIALRGEVQELLKRDRDALLSYEEALDMNRALLDDLLQAGQDQ